MAAKVGQVIVNFLLNTAKFEDDIKKATKSFRAMGREFTETGMSLTKTVTLPLVAMGAAAVKAAMDIDEGLDKIRAATGATGKAWDNLGNNMRNVMKNVPQGVNDVATAIANLNTRLGLSGQPLEKMATQMLNLSRLTGEEVGATIQSVTETFGKWTVATEDQSEALDYFYKVSQSTGISIGELTDLMSRFGAPLQNLGFDLETAAVMMGKWSKEGINVEQVMMGLSKGMAAFAKAGIAPSEALEKMQSAIKGAKTEAEAIAIAVKIFGQRAGPELAKAIQAGRFSIDDLKNALDKSGESINKAAADTLSFQEKMGLLRNQVMTALEPIGVRLLGAIEKLIPAFQGVLESLTKAAEWFGNLPPVIQNTILGVTALAAAIGPLLLVFGNVFTTISKVLPLLGAKGLLGLLPGLAKGITGITMAMGPWGLALTAIGLLLITFHEQIEDCIVSFLRWVGLADKLPEVVGINQSAMDRLTKTWDANQKTMRLSEETWNSFLKVNKNAPDVFEANRKKIWDLQQSLSAGRIKQTEYEAELRKLLGTTPKVTDATKGLGTAFDVAGLSTNKVKNEMESLGKAMKDSIAPMDALMPKYENLQKLGYSLSDIAKVYGDEILNASQKQTQFGGTLSEGERLMAAAAFEAKLLADRTKEMAVGFSLCDRTGENLNSVLSDMAPKMEKVNNEVVGVADLWGWWNDRVKQGEPGLRSLDNVYLPDIEANMKWLKEAMGQAGDETEKSEKKMTKFGETVSTSLTNMTQSIAGKVIKWGGFFGDFARGATSSFMEGLFNPIIGKLTDLGNIFSNWVNDLLKKLGSSLLSWVTGTLGKILGLTGGGGGGGFGGLLSNLGGALLGGGGGGGGGVGGMLGGGLLGGLLGGGGGAAGAAASITGAGLAGGGMIGGTAAGEFVGPIAASGAAGGGLGGIGSAIAAFATNPVTIALAAAAAAGFGIYKLIGAIKGPNSYEAASEEAQRDFSVSINPKGIQALFDAVGVTEPQAWDIRKSLLVSPVGLLFMAKYAEEQKAMDKYVARLANVQTSWGTFEFKTPFLKGISTGSWEDLNAAYASAFSVDKKLNEKLPNWRSVLMLSNTGAAVAPPGGEERPSSYLVGTSWVPMDMWYYLHRGERVVSAPENRAYNLRSGDVFVTINVMTGGNDLVQTVKTQVIPILKRELAGGNTGFREAIRFAYDHTRKAY